MRRLLLAAALTAVLVGLSGCATVSVTAEVGGPDTIDSYRMDIETSTTVYGFLNEGAKQQGYDGLEDQIRSEVNVSDEQITYRETIDGTDANISIELTDVSPAALDNVSVTTTEDGRIRYEDRQFAGEASAGGVVGNGTGVGNGTVGSGFGRGLASGFVLKYTVVMPTDVTNSTADEVDGRRASWTRSGADAFGNTTVRATSEAPSSGLAPGFGPVAALGALAASLAGALAVRRWRG